MRTRLLPAAVADKPSTEELVAQLDDDDFEKREEATRALADRGEVVVPKLQAALKASRSAEVRARVEHILKQFTGTEGKPSAEQLRALRAVAALSRIETAASRALLAEIARGAEERPQTAAARAVLGLPEKSDPKAAGMGMGN